MQNCLQSSKRYQCEPRLPTMQAVQHQHSIQSTNYNIPRSTQRCLKTAKKTCSLRIHPRRAQQSMPIGGIKLLIAEFKSENYRKAKKLSSRLREHLQAQREKDILKKQLSRRVMFSQKARARQLVKQQHNSLIEQVRRDKFKELSRQHIKVKKEELQGRILKEEDLSIATYEQELAFKSELMNRIMKQMQLL